MSTLEYRLKDPAYKNWVKIGLCLALVKEGLEEYAEIKSKEFHDAVLASVAKIQTHQTAICDNEKITFDNKNNGKIACNHAFCQGFLNEVVSLGIDPTLKFKIRKANIENCDVKLWPTDHWELAKLFMNQGQKPCQTNPSQTDLSGILNFLKHCRVPRNGLHNVQHIDEVRQTRNSVMHTPDMIVSPATFQTDTQTMLDLLRDPNLAKLSSVKHAESEIQKVIQADFQILLEDEIKVIKNWTAAIEKDTNYTKTAIRELRKEVASMQQTGDEEKKTLQTQIKQMEEKANKIADSLAALTTLVLDGKTLQEQIGLEVKNLHVSLEQGKKDFWNAHNELKRRVNETELKIINTAQERKVLYDLQAKFTLKTSTSNYAKKRKLDDTKRQDKVGKRKRKALDEQDKIESQVKAMNTPTITDEGRVRGVYRLERPQHVELGTASRFTVPRGEEVQSIHHEHIFDCRKLRQSMVGEYTRIYRCISLSPLVEELNDDALRIPIDKVYCDLDIVKVKDKSSAGTSANKPLKSYSEMFADTEIKNIVIKGEGGTGKSTWCKWLLHAWCQVQRRELGMEGASDEANSDMEESLKRFDYLFFVTLRHVKYQSPLKDILLSARLERLSMKRYVCEFILANNSKNVLILVDGFDEYPFTLDCDGLGDSKIVMTTRPWKYDVLLSKDNNFKVDAVSEIRGLTSLGIRELSKKVIASYSKQSPDLGFKRSNEEEQTDSEVCLDDIDSAELSDSINIPLILIITVLSWLEKDKSLSKSTTYMILDLLKVIFDRGKTKLSETDKQALKRAEQEKKETPVFHKSLTAKYNFMYDNQVLLQHLGRLAYTELTNQNKGLSLVFSKDELHEFLDSEELEICYKLGLLTASAVTISLLVPPQVSISFYHKLFQELFAAIGVICDSDTTLSEFKNILTSLKAVLEMENVIIFITALNPCIGSDLSKHIADLAEADASVCKSRRENDIFGILENYCNLLFKCLSELDSGMGKKEQKQLYLTDLIIESDFERKVHLCTYLSGKKLKSLTVTEERLSYESVNITQILSQLAKLTAEAAPLQFLDIFLDYDKQDDIETTATTNFDLTEIVHLERVSIRGITSAKGQYCLGLTFGKMVQLKKMRIENAVVNTLYLQNITSLELKNVLVEIRLPTKMERLEYVKLQSVTMPELSWNSFFQCLQSPSVTELILQNLNIDDITINLEKSSGLEWLQLKDVKVGEIRLPTRLERLAFVILQSVSMPGSSWNSCFQSPQSPSLTSLILTNLNTDDITINLENSSRISKLVLEDMKVREIRLPTRQEKLKYVKLQSVTMPELSWNSFFKSLYAASLTKLTLKNLNTDDITINLDNNSGLQRLVLEDVKVREIRLPTRLEQLHHVILQSVSMPGSSWNRFLQSLQSPSLISLILKNLNTDVIKLPNCERLEHLEISNMKLAEIHVSSTERLLKIKIDEIALPESQANSFFNQVLFSTRLRQLTMKNISLGEGKVEFDWKGPNSLYEYLFRLAVEFQIQLENVTMSLESYKCLCTLLRHLRVSENVVTKQSVDRGLLNVTVKGGKYFEYENLICQIAKQ